MPAIATRACRGGKDMCWHSTTPIRDNRWFCSAPCWRVRPRGCRAWPAPAHVAGGWNTESDGVRRDVHAELQHAPSRIRGRPTPWCQLAGPLRESGVMQTATTGPAPDLTTPATPTASVRPEARSAHLAGRAAARWADWSARNSRTTPAGQSRPWRSATRASSGGSGRSARAGGGGSIPVKHGRNQPHNGDLDRLQRGRFHQPHVAGRAGA